MHPWAAMLLLLAGGVTLVLDTGFRDASFVQSSVTSAT
jgi:hypothetical protein